MKLTMACPLGRADTGVRVSWLAIAATMAMVGWCGYTAAVADEAHATTQLHTDTVLQEAPAVHLRLRYRTMNIGSDGVQREASYTKTMHRVGQRIWLEKDQPQALRESLGHGHGVTRNLGSHAGHAHTLAQEAPLMVQRDERGDIDVLVVLEALQQLISVDQAHHANVGYNGSWEATYWLVPPAALKALQAVGKPRDGIQLYRRFVDESMTEVAWDIDMQYPRRVLQRGPHDTTFYQLTAEEIETPEVLPWSLLGDYRMGDYSDLLD